MKAVRVKQTSADGVPYTADNPAPSSAIEVVENVPRPQASQHDELIVQVKATTVTRDSLLWPELYSDPPAHMGNDFSGVVVNVHDAQQDFAVGDEVYGMTSASHGGAWAEYVKVTTEEVSKKPANLSWEEAAALPMCAMTADQALFTHAKLEAQAQKPKRVLITGASGSVGIFLVQFANIAGHHTIAASGSNARNETFLRSLGASETIEYGALPSIEPVDVVIDTVGGSVLASCWRVVKPDATMVTIESASYQFGDDHRKQGLTNGKIFVGTIFFVVEPSRKSMEHVSKLVLSSSVKGQVARIERLTCAREAYEMSYSREFGRGKVVLMP